MNLIKRNPNKLLITYMGEDYMIEKNRSITTGTEITVPIDMIEAFLGTFPEEVRDNMMYEEFRTL